LAEIAAQTGPTEELARRAREGDARARNELWDLYAGLVRDAVSRQRALPRLWDRDDLRQEAYLVFADLCETWPGGGFGAYAGLEYPRRLRNHVRRAWRKQQRETTVSRAIELGGDADAEGQYGLAELLEGLSRLPRPVEAALRLHVLWGLPLHQVGRQTGLGRRMLGGLLPLARAALLEGEDARLERLVRELYAFADRSGRIRGTGRQVRAALGLTAREHAELLETLEECGVLTARAPGHAGRLPVAGPEAAVRLLRRRRHPRSA
jgi:DNA-directed RNA polymerase specialized sigma24 family protein